MDSGCCGPDVALCEAGVRCLVTPTNGDANLPVHCKAVRGACLGWVTSLVIFVLCTGTYRGTTTSLCYDAVKQSWAKPSLAWTSCRIRVMSDADRAQMRWQTVQVVTGGGRAAKDALVEKLKRWQAWWGRLQGGLDVTEIQRFLLPPSAYAFSLVYTVLCMFPWCETYIG